MECTIGNVKIPYHIYGSGRPVLIIHGLTLDHRSMTGFMEPVFSARDEEWKRIYIDLPGMGESKGYEELNGSDEMLDMVLQFIDQMIPEESLLVVGQSYGGYIARGIISKKREQVGGAALICPMIVPDKNERDLPLHQVIYQDENLLSQLNREERKDFQSLAIVQDEAYWNRYRNEILPGRSRADSRFIDKLLSQYAFSFDVDQRVPSFEKPVLLVTGRQDSMVGYQDAWRLLENFPRCTFTVLDRAGHNLQLEQPSLLHRLCDEWLDRVVENGPSYR
ncbi:pimeloyl-ACP methyl ester carboxylesterase [Croceifilum oryzae]|uniref:Pimeloyl-ACP methyl ester carboxylesterase n=1 Tax=Croceifilum oryzae TaxID=1553429 RepID=A0AAJ1TGZ7_9BACL|nr:alpha/beta hydrolase [Croceifilum oryzae]MDQ0418299.1 pimeloyl-ACP methyl ester carboxylesterase [Croceifilum oryzae]